MKNPDWSIFHRMPWMSGRTLPLSRIYPGHRSKCSNIQVTLFRTGLLFCSPNHSARFVHPEYSNRAGIRFLSVQNREWLEDLCPLCPMWRHIPAFLSWNDKFSRWDWVHLSCSDPHCSKSWLPLWTRLALFLFCCWNGQIYRVSRILSFPDLGWLRLEPISERSWLWFNL